MSKHKLGAELAIELVGDKWFILVMDRLRKGSHRFNELKRDVPGISQRMLTRTLRSMERDGLVDRKVYAVVPPHTEYSLTPLGVTLLDPLRTLCHWATRHYSDVLANRAKSARRNLRKSA